MVAQKSGLIINVSSVGGLKYLFNVAYGVGKAGVDRMAADMAEELKPHGIPVLSFWPGAVKTEMFDTIIGEMEKEPEIEQNGFKTSDMTEVVERGESPGTSFPPPHSTRTRNS